MKIQETIKQLRETYGFNQKQLALKMGITPASYSRVESGRDMPTQQFLMNLAEATGTELVIMFEEKYDPEVIKALVSAVKEYQAPIEIVSPVMVTDVMVIKKASVDPPVTVGWRDKIKDGKLTTLKKQKDAKEENTND